MARDLDVLSASRLFFFIARWSRSKVQFGRLRHYKRQKRGKGKPDTPWTQQSGTSRVFRHLQDLNWLRQISHSDRLRRCQSHKYRATRQGRYPLTLVFQIFRVVSYMGRVGGHLSREQRQDTHTICSLAFEGSQHLLKEQIFVTATAK